MPPDDLPSRVIKYIPGEIVALYLACLGILSVGEVPTSIYWLVFGVLLIIAPLYTWRLSQYSMLPTALAQIVVAAIAFVVWAYALGMPFTLLGWYNPAVASVLVLLCTGIPPLFLK